MAQPWKKPKHQGKASTNGNQQQMNVITNGLTNAKQIEIEQKVIMYIHLLLKVNIL
jgi:hypothetical protein